MITRQWMIRFFAGIALLSMLAGCGSANAGTSNPAAAPASTPTPAPTLMATINSNAAKSNKTAKADEMELLFVPAGTFPMGGAEIDEKAGEDEKPAHTVYTDAFWIDRTEVTVRQYTLCVKAGACKEPLAISAGDLKNYFYETAYANFPVVNIRWDDAKTYCDCDGRRLPTEAEWEKAARGDDRRIYPWGNKAADQSLANFNWLVRHQVAVGSYPAGASPFKVLDMAGNVAEWVADLYKDDYYKETPDRNPTGPSATFRGQAHVIRGGHFQSADSEIRTSKRGFGLAVDAKNPGAEPFYSSTDGFRCAMADK